MSGPFTGYVPPNVYTETLLDPAAGGLLGSVRIPTLVGTAEEIKTLNGYDISRGSSPTRDNQKINEDVSGQADGTNRDFFVANFPITTGQGGGIITYNVNDVVVKVNGEQAIVAKVDGLNGKVTLALAPKSVDVTTITYWYKKTDTKVIDENLSSQIDVDTKTFFTHFSPIVDGTNAGKTTTNVNSITVKVNGSIVEVANLNGSDGAFTLKTVPPLSATLTVTYYFNKYANTSDDLPVSGLLRVLRVGMSPDTSDFIENVDFAIIGDQIQWGSGYKLVTDVHTTGSEFFDDSQISGQLVDDIIYNEDVSNQCALVATTEFTVSKFPIVDGSGHDTISENPSDVIVTVNGIQVAVRKIDGATGKIKLMVAAAIGAIVLITYYRARLEDDTYTMEVAAVGGVGVGTYTITSAEDGRLGIAVPGTINIDVGASVVWTTGLTVEKGYTVDEVITLTFTSPTEFSVVSSIAPAGTNGFGVTGRTYIDSVTGLMFTLAPSPFVIGNTIQINVTKEATFMTSVTPITSVPGLRVTVNNTTDCSSGDTTNLITFNKSGKEPNVGDIYYISYEYLKTDYDCKLFTKFKDVLNEYGPLSVNNPMTLAAYYCYMNGAVALICCQAKKALNSEEAADSTYYDILERLKQPVDGQKPSIIVPLTTSQAVIGYCNNHVNQQSSKRYRNERICFFGFATGTEPSEAAEFAESIRNERLTCIYPDGAVIELSNPDGTVQEAVVDGTYLAASYAGLNVSPIYDVAEPMTRKSLVGLTKLVRQLDEPTMDMVASKGVTLLEKVGATFTIRHGLTTNMASSLTREQNIITIRDFIQQEARRVLNPYIGRKFTANVPNDMITTLSSMLRAAIDKQIIVNYKGVSAERDKVEPDYIKMTAYYIPIIGLNYVEVSFNVRIRF
jgi:hypothetical protein